MISGALWLLVELTALFFGVAFAIQLLQRRLGHERIRSWMGGSPLSSALKGIAIGFVTPFCTYSAIPMLIGLRRAGVPTAGYVAFLAAAPVLDPVLFGALTLIVGLQAAVIYSLVAFVSAITLAMVAQRVGIDHRLKIPVAEPAVASHSAAAVPTGFLVSPGLPTSQPLVEAEPEPTTSCSTSGTGDLPWAGLRAESVDAARAAITLLRSVSGLLLVGVFVGLLIEATVSPETVAAITRGKGMWSIPVAAALGTPLYFHTGLFVPIANALTKAGLSIGAIVALTISGAGANVPEFILLTKLAERRLIAIFFAYVFVVAMVGGLLAQMLLT